MSLLYPKLQWRWLPRLLGYSLLGALIAGFYGILHDQITYTISPEYFTRLKFHQFAYADFGLPRRVFVGEVGLLATWWVGFIAGWFLARATLNHRPEEALAKWCFQGFAILFAGAVAGGIGGLTLDWLQGADADLSAWRYFSETLGVTDLRHFAQVGFIHSGGYLGALVGLVIAWRRICASRSHDTSDRGRGRGSG